MIQLYIHIPFHLLFHPGFNRSGPHDHTVLSARKFLNMHPQIYVKLLIIRYIAPVLIEELYILYNITKLKLKIEKNGENNF